MVEIKRYHPRFLSGGREISTNALELQRDSNAHTSMSRMRFIMHSVLNANECKHTDYIAIVSRKIHMIFQCISFKNSNEVVRALDDDSLSMKPLINSLLGRLTTFL